MRKAIADCKKKLHVFFLQSPGVAPLVRTLHMLLHRFSVSVHWYALGPRPCNLVYLGLKYALAPALSPIGPNLQGVSREATGY